MNTTYTCDFDHLPTVPCGRDTRADQGDASVSSCRPGASRKIPSLETRGMPSRMAVAAIQRSAS